MCQVKLWNVATGEERLTLPEPNKRATDLAFSPDGKKLAVGYYGDLVLFRADISSAGNSLDDPARAIAWHEQEAGDAQERKQWYAAAFHMLRLIDLGHKQNEFRKDMVEVLNRLKTEDEGRYRLAWRMVRPDLARELGLESPEVKKK